MSARMKGLFVGMGGMWNHVFTAEQQGRLGEMVEFYAPPQTAEMVQANPEILREADVVIGAWGMPKLDAAMLAHAPRLKGVFYAGGTIRGFVSDAFWERGLIVTSAWAMNAVPVAEYTVAQIVLSMKQTWMHMRRMHGAKGTERPGRLPMAGVMPTSTVGLISLGMIGQRVARMLQAYELKVVAYDPFVKPEVARELKVELVGLEELFGRSDVVSLHTPWLPQTVGMITGAHFAAMKKGATFINTSRGAIVREAEMIEVLRQRPDLVAVLDVTYPEPPEAGSALYELGNVFLTPHVAGSCESESKRMGESAIGELGRFLRGERLEWSVSREKAAMLA